MSERGREREREGEKESERAKVDRVRMIVREGEKERVWKGEA